MVINVARLHPLDADFGAEASCIADAMGEGWPAKS
jgi:hypothetical protein